MLFVSSILYRMAKNWIAGKELSDAISSARVANSRGLSVIINYLGEDINNKSEVETSVKEYKKLIDAVKKSKINGCISVKLTQMGLDIDTKYCRRNIETVTNYAKKIGMFVWIDMEGSEFTDQTIDIYTSIIRKNKKIGLCIQSNLKRSYEDLRKLVKVGGKIRLVKGAYNEPRDISYKGKREVNERYMMLTDYLFKNSRNIFSISTHDGRLVDAAIEDSKSHNVNFEFGMLKGIRNNLKSELVKDGYHVTEYIPYGERWMPYSIRRIKEKPSNIILLIMSLVSK